MDNFNDLIKLIKNAKYCVAFTGAGISTLAGIKDFRGKNGLYKQPNTEQMFDINVFNSDPSIYYNLAKDFIYGLDQKQPAIVHSVLAKLEAEGIIKAVITQNIDLLHQKAGSKNVIEIHGSPSIHYCRSCGKEYTFKDVYHTAHTGEVPHCECGGVLKPRITFFGESLPIEALTEAEYHSSIADLMLVLGSSLTVFPAASLPAYTLRKGGQIVIVNEQQTNFDPFCELRYNDLEKTFNYLDENFFK